MLVLTLVVGRVMCRECVTMCMRVFVYAIVEGEQDRVCQGVECVPSVYVRMRHQCTRGMLWIFIITSKWNNSHGLFACDIETSFPNPE